ITGPWGDRARLSAAGEQWQAFHPTGGAKELDVKRFRILGALATLCALLFAPDSAEAQAGPGLGNLDCGDQEYFRPFAFIENDGDPRGTNVSVMIRGYFMTIFAPDSGHPPGEIALYDLSDPRTPVEVDHIENADTDVFREAHSLPVALIDGRQYIAI